MSTLPSDTAVSLIDLRSLAQQELPLQGQTRLQAFERLTDLPSLAEAGLPADASVQWAVRAEWRERLPAGGPGEIKGVQGSEPQLWLHLAVQASVPQVCQRCLSPYAETLDIDRWFRFVNDEDAANAEDDDCEEDLLVWSPKFNLHELIEDEMLMGLPLVPMHGACPQQPRMSAGEELLTPEAERPNPFAALAGLKVRSSDRGPK